MIGKKKPSRPNHKSQTTNRKSPIRALFFDVDGVLTDGRIYLAGDGTEFKVFDTKDGHGMRKAIAAGLKIAWISGRTSPATAARARDLGVHACFQGVRDKLAKYETVRRRWPLAVSVSDRPSATTNPTCRCWRRPASPRARPTPRPRP